MSNKVCVNLVSFKKPDVKPDINVTTGLLIYGNTEEPKKCCTRLFYAWDEMMDVEANRYMIHHTRHPGSVASWAGYISLIRPNIGLCTYYCSSASVIPYMIMLSILPDGRYMNVNNHVSHIYMHPMLQQIFAAPVPFTGTDSGINAICSIEKLTFTHGKLEMLNIELWNTFRTQLTTMPQYKIGYTGAEIDGVVVYHDPVMGIEGNPSKKLSFMDLSNVQPATKTADEVRNHKRKLDELQLNYDEICAKYTKLMAFTQKTANNLNPHLPEQLKIVIADD